MSHERIRIRGATQNNLKNLDLDLPLHELVVVNETIRGLIMKRASGEDIRAAARRGQAARR